MRIIIVISACIILTLACVSPDPATSELLIPTPTLERGAQEISSEITNTSDDFIGEVGGIRIRLKPALELGFSEEDYWSAMGTNVEMQSTEALDASSVAQAVVEFMQDKTDWQGTPSELYAMLNEIAESLGINTAATENKRKKQARDWPADANWLTRKLNLVVPNLAQVGLIFEQNRVERRRIIVLRREKAS